jgi:Fe-S-cluster containining protein
VASENEFEELPKSVNWARQTDLVLQWRAITNKRAMPWRVRIQALLWRWLPWRDVSVQYEHAPNGCSSKCCQNLCISATHEKIRKLAKTKSEFGNPSSSDNIFVAKMLIPLGRWKGRGPEGQSENEWNHEFGRMVYTCKFFDWTNGRCSIYENRPYLCRNHEQSVCQYQGCANDSNVETIPEINLTKKIQSKGTETK